MPFSSVILFMPEKVKVIRLNEPVGISVETTPSEIAKALPVGLLEVPNVPV